MRQQGRRPAAMNVQAAALSRYGWLDERLRSWVSSLAYLPTCRDLPAAFHPATAAVPDLVVQVHRRATVARHYPDFLSHPHRSIDLDIAVLLIQFPHGPGAPPPPPPPDEVAERSGTHRLIPRERF